MQTAPVYVNAVPVAQRPVLHAAPVHTSVHSSRMNSFELPRSSVPWRSSFPRLHNDILQFLWAITFTIGSGYLFLFELPFRIALAFTSFIQDVAPPLGFLKTLTYNFSWTVYEWTLPLRSLVESTVFSVFDFADTLLTRGLKSAMNTPKGTVKGFQNAFDAYMHLIHEKTEIIERNGPKGIPMLFSPRGAVAHSA